MAQDDTVTVEAPVFQGPALEATSDMPVVEKPADPPPENVEVNTAEVKETEAENEEATGAGTGEEIQTAPEAGKDETPPYVKREITKARNRQREAEAQAREAGVSRDAAIKALETLTAERATEAAKPKFVVETPRPKRETFDNPDAYDAALVEWAADNAARKATEEVRADEARKASDDAKRRTEDEGKKRVTEKLTSWTEKRSEFMKAHPDFEDIAESDDLKVSPVMTELLLEADNGPELAYALGKNPDLAARIAQLSPAKAALEMGRLAASVDAARKPKVSKAPPPVRPVGTRANAGTKSPDEMSMDEYAAMRTPQIIADRLGPTARPRA